MITLRNTGRFKNHSVWLSTQFLTVPGFQPLCISVCFITHFLNNFHNKWYWFVKKKDVNTVRVWKYEIQCQCVYKCEAKVAGSTCFYMEYFSKIDQQLLFRIDRIVIASKGSKSHDFYCSMLKSWWITKK